MRILGIETSCDETGIAVYDDEKGLLSHELYSQVKLHADYGGVVPELASRDHVRKIIPLIEKAMEDANTAPFEIDGVAFTQGPGWHRISVVHQEDDHRSHQRLPTIHRQ